MFALFHCLSYGLVTTKTLDYNISTVKAECAVHLHSPRMSTVRLVYACVNQCWSFPEPHRRSFHGSWRKIQDIIIPGAGRNSKVIKQLKLTVLINNFIIYISLHEEDLISPFSVSADTEILWVPSWLPRVPQGTIPFKCAFCCVSLVRASKTLRVHLLTGCSSERGRHLSHPPAVLKSSLLPIFLKQEKIT